VTRILLTDETVRRAWRETTRINPAPAEQPAQMPTDPHNETLIRQLAWALFGDPRTDSTDRDGTASR
jgi:hypothetical protein